MTKNFHIVTFVATIISTFALTLNAISHSMWAHAMGVFLLGLAFAITQTVLLQMDSRND